MQCVCVYACVCVCLGKGLSSDPPVLLGRTLRVGAKTLHPVLISTHWGNVSVYTFYEHVFTFKHVLLSCAQQASFYIAPDIYIYEMPNTNVVFTNLHHL